LYREGTAVRCERTCQIRLGSFVDCWFNERRSRVVVIASHKRDRDSGSTYQTDTGLTFEHRFTNVIRGRIGYRHGNSTDDGPFTENRLLVEQIFACRCLAPCQLSSARARISAGSIPASPRGCASACRCNATSRIGSYRFTPCASAEGYFDTRYDQTARYRPILGVTFTRLRAFQH
jgi:hypothetical protein